MPALEVLDHFEQLIRPLEESAYVGARDEAMARIEQRDARDWPILAAALTLSCPIWTEDQDLFMPMCPHGPLTALSSTSTPTPYADLPLLGRPYADPQSVHGDWLGAAVAGGV